MTTQPSTQARDNDSTLDPSGEAPSHDVIEDVKAACRKVPPLWPLTHFVAVNPFLGFSGSRFDHAVETLQRIAHCRLTADSQTIQKAWSEAGITDAMLTAAARGSSWTIPELVDELARANHNRPPHPPGHPAPGGIALAASPCCGEKALTVADELDSLHGTAWSPLVTEEISKWCAAYYDDGQALWKMPWRSLSIFRAWKRGAAMDRTMEVSGVQGFRLLIPQLPDDALLAIQFLLDEMDVPPPARGDFLHRQLMTIRGWAGYVQYRVREKELRGDLDDSLVELLAIRLSYDLALWRAFGPLSNFPRPATPASRKPALLVWQEALEMAARGDLISRLTQAPGAGPIAGRPGFQAVFCIDVRSEVFRRAVESASPGCETIGFAGFFGFPIETCGANGNARRCPVLLVPDNKVEEEPACTHPAGIPQFKKRIAAARAIAAIWKTFKSASITCFPFVECFGLAFLPKLLSKSLASGGQPSTGMETTYRIDSITADKRIALAEGALRHMGLTTNFARLVLLCGHGGRTENNPFASSLDCGACGGHAGDANARVAAMVLNDPATRDGLAARGIPIPPDTIFLGGLHNTTTDDVEIFEENPVPASHAADLERLKVALAGAGALARRERSASLGLAATTPEAIDSLVRKRSQDWAEVRPEWGLAGNCAFIAAPRQRTRNLSLHGRAFLHNYEAANDPGGRTLELILTAPMVVASWINLQYYASSADNSVFGSGNKVLHNVVGKIGVLEGNSGDLRPGLPLQSVHSGRESTHTPLRLNVVIEADPAAIDAVLAKHSHVHDLVSHAWIHLHAWQGTTHLHRTPEGPWVPVEPLRN